VRAVMEVKPFHLTHQFGETSGPGSRNYSCAGVAVLADSTWAAMQARKSLEVDWDEGNFAQESSAGLRERMLKLTSAPAATIRSDGDFEKAHAAAAKRIEAVYEVPFLAHATMEPMNCTAHFHDGECELWVPTQVPGAAAESVAKALGIPGRKSRCTSPSSAVASAAALFRTTPSKPPSFPATPAPRPGRLDSRGRHPP